jgi:ParB family chromosome partitioning protein
MSTSRPALGRGLSSLIPSSGKGAGVDTVDIDLIAPNPEQPRTHFDQDAMEELAESIREHGVLQPVIVTRVQSDIGPATYQLIAGERRLQAARMAGVTRMPVVIKEAAAKELLELALVENIQRQDLNPIEEATAFRRLNEEFRVTQDEIARRVGRSRTAVGNIVRLLSLEPDIRKSLASGQISEGHARTLLAIEDAHVRLDAWRRIVQDDLTVRQAEEIAKQLRRSSGKVITKSGRMDRRTTTRKDAQVRGIEEDLRYALGARVSVTRGRTGGRITISFHNDEELEGIVERICSAQA